MKIFNTTFSCILVFFVAGLLAFPQVLLAQNADRNNDAMTRARNNFNEGNFEESLLEIDQLLESKNRQDRRDAYELQAEIYLAQEERELADGAMKKLLNSHWGYKADATNPDLYHLFRSFRSDPVMYFSGRLGVNQSVVIPYANYGAGNTLRQNATFSDDFTSFQLGGGMTFALNKSLEFGLEVLFSKKDFEYAETMNTGSLGEPSFVHQLSLRENQSWLDIPVLATYTFRIFRPDGRPWIFFPFVSAGLNFGYLQADKFESLKRVTTGGLENEVFTIEEPPVNLLQGNSLRRSLHMSLIGSAGIRFPIGNDYFGIDYRYSFGFQNLVKAENRYARSDLVYKYGYVDDDMRMDHHAISLSYVWSIYIPKKKRAYRVPKIYPEDPYPYWIDSVEKVKFWKETDEVIEDEPVVTYSTSEIEEILQNTIESMKDIDSLEAVLVRELAHLRQLRTDREKELEKTVEDQLKELEDIIEQELRLLAKEKKRLKESLREGHLDQLDEEIKALKKIREDVENRIKEQNEEAGKK